MSTRSLCLCIAWMMTAAACKGGGQTPPTEQASSQSPESENGAEPRQKVDGPATRVEKRPERKRPAAGPLTISAGAIGDLNGDIPLEHRAVQDLLPGYDVRVLESKAEGSPQTLREILVFHQRREFMRLTANDKGNLELAIVVGPGPHDDHGIGVGASYQKLKSTYADLTCERNRTNEKSEFGALDLVTCKSGALAGVEFNFNVRGEEFPGSKLPDERSLGELRVENITVELAER